MTQSALCWPPHSQWWPVLLPKVCVVNWLLGWTGGWLDCAGGCRGRVGAQGFSLPFSGSRLLLQFFTANLRARAFWPSLLLGAECCKVSTLLTIVTYLQFQVSFIHSDTHTLTFTPTHLCKLTRGLTFIQTVNCMSLTSC